MDSAPSSPQPSGSEREYALLRELAEELLAPRFDFQGSAARPQLHVGALPPDLPVVVPIPEGARLVGSRSDSLDPQRAAIVLTLDRSEEEVRTLFHDALISSGWTEPLEPPGVWPRGGFMATVRMHLQPRMYLHEQQRVTLNVGVRPEANQPTTAHLELREMVAPPLVLGTPPGHMNVMEQLIPALRPPEGAIQQPGGGGGGGSTWRSEANVRSELDCGTLADHYERQLAAGGWTRREGERGAHFAWSAWTFTDPQNDPWLGTFFLFRYHEAPSSYQAGVRIEWTGEGSQRTGGPFLAGRHIGTQTHTVE